MVGEDQNERAQYTAIERVVWLQYVGSFSVVGEDQNERAQYVRKQLMQMRVGDAMKYDL